MRKEIHRNGNHDGAIPEISARTPRVLLVVYLIILAWAALAWVRG